MNSRRINQSSDRLWTPRVAALYLGCVGEDFVRAKMATREIRSIDPHGNGRDVYTTKEWIDEWVESAGQSAAYDPRRGVAHGVTQLIGENPINNKGRRLRPTTSNNFQ